MWPTEMRKARARSNISPSPTLGCIVAADRKGLPSRIAAIMRLMDHFGPTSRKCLTPFW